MSRPDIPKLRLPHPPPSASRGAAVTAGSSAPAAGRSALARVRRQRHASHALSSRQASKNASTANAANAVVVSTQYGAPQRFATARSHFVRKLKTAADQERAQLLGGTSHAASGATSAVGDFALRSRHERLRRRRLLDDSGKAAARSTGKRAFHSAYFADLRDVQEPETVRLSRKVRRGVASVSGAVSARRTPRRASRKLGGRMSMTDLRLLVGDELTEAELQRVDPDASTKLTLQDLILDTTRDRKATQELRNSYNPTHAQVENRIKQRILDRKRERERVFRKSGAATVRASNFDRIAFNRLRESTSATTITIKHKRLSLPSGPTGTVKPPASPRRASVTVAGKPMVSMQRSRAVQLPSKREAATSSTTPAAKPRPKSSTDRPLTVHDVMALLDHSKMEFIKKDFQRLNNSLSLTEFVAVMSAYLPTNEGGPQDGLCFDRAELTGILCEMFANVDVNGDGTMEWDEFTSHIVEMALTSNSRSGDGSSTDAAKSDYRVSSTLDTSSRTVRGSRPSLGDMLYIPELDHLAVREPSTHCLRIVHGRDSHLVATLKGHHGPVLGITYLPHFGFLATSSTDRTTRFWMPKPGVMGDQPEPPGRGKPKSKKRASEGSDAGQDGDGSDSEDEEQRRERRRAFELDKEEDELLTAEDITKMMLSDERGGFDIIKRLPHKHKKRGTSADKAKSGDTEYSFGSDVASGQYQAVKCLIHDQSAQGVLCWVEREKLLFSADDTLGRIVGRRLVYRLDTKTGMEYQHENVVVLGYAELLSAQQILTLGMDAAGSAPSGVYEGHKEPVLDMLVLENLGLLATASMDCTIRLWNLKTRELHSVLKGHSRGVCHLSYHADYHVLLSAGYETDALVWAPNCAKKICRLSGHFHPLVGIQAVENTPQIVTVDQEGIAKVWDIRNYACIQTLYVEDGNDARVPAIRSLVVCPRHRRLTFAGSDALLHHYDSVAAAQEREPDLCDLDPPLCAFLCAPQGLLVSAAGRSLKLWHEADGALATVLHNVSDVEITACCLDPASKKVVIGDASGGVAVVNLFSGAVMKRCSPTLHGGAISHLEFVADSYSSELEPTWHVLSTSMDGVLRLLDETQEDELTLVRELTVPKTRQRSSAQHDSEILCCAFSVNLSMIATGSASGQVLLWDHADGFHDVVGELTGHTSELTAFAFLDPFPVLASADSAGNVCLWAVRPVVGEGGVCFVRLCNTQGNRRDPSLASPVTSMSFAYGKLSRSFDMLRLSRRRRRKRTPPPLENPCALLFTADSNGEIKCWDVARALARFNLVPLLEHPAGLLASMQFGSSTRRSSAARSRCSSAEAKEEERSKSHRSRTTRYLVYRRDVLGRMPGGNMLATMSPVECSEQLAPGDVQMRFSWQAHTDSIRSLALVKRQPIDANKPERSVQTRHWLEENRSTRELVKQRNEQRKKVQASRAQRKWEASERAQSTRDLLAALKQFTADGVEDVEEEKVVAVAKEEVGSEEEDSDEEEQEEAHVPVLDSWVLLTCSFDRTVALWNIHGQPLGQLRQGFRAGDVLKPQAARPWRFSSDLEQRLKREERVRQAERVMKVVDHERARIVQRLRHELNTAAAFEEYSKQHSYHAQLMRKLERELMRGTADVQLQRALLDAGQLHDEDAEADQEQEEDRVFLTQRDVEAEEL